MTDEGVTRAAELFKALSSSSRLRILTLLSASPATVTQLVAATGQSQPLVSQHLKTLRLANIVTVVKVGRESTYTVADSHVTHVVEDAISHVLEDPADNS
ncbi:ArsR family transcriptional regulator [Cryobacterium sp. TMS1-20-1]|uniref:ArsR/SmtB family transcription factor n=1 Tax=unclassified Cryobacterium TaxID=2649013 RepID=UPI0010694730|nr:MULTISPECIES: metalloregulator ArsR/SmtB family transcription factor [unclassified Cryobacterium]TFC70638.1 ArsR family transcriptional regulator [Cryobacterium sp. TMS1-20-1]TFD54899.1 ArsR family transcriptional regulator [Cryobacterium sp. Hh7]